MRLIAILAGLLALLTGASAYILSPSLRSDANAVLAPLHASLVQVQTELPGGTAQPVASSTLPASIGTTTTRATTTTPSKKPAATTTAPPPVTLSPAAPTTPPVTAIEPVAPSSSPTIAAGETKALALVLPKLRSASVNIVCLPADSSMRGISGSGVIIDSRGIIMTAAHVGQFLLLAEAKPNAYSCVVRTGSPATKAYTAQVVYISPAWVKDNPKVISAKDPIGTGENDFALIAITGSATSTPLATSFISVPLSSEVSEVGESIVIGTYGAEFLDTAHVRSSLYPTLVYGSVKDRYTFDTDTVDVLSLGGGAAAQEGSSGGGAANERGQIIGLITTSSVGKDIATRDLRAITPNHIRRSFAADTGENLDTYLRNRSISALIKDFSSQAQQLATLLIKANGLSSL